MNKIFVILIISSALILSQNKFASLAHADNLRINDEVKIDDQSNIFGFPSQNQNKDHDRDEDKNKFQLKIHDNDNNEEDETNEQKNQSHDFTIKGVITASSSSSLTINSQVINIDPSITGNVKIVGNIEVGMYAMVQGEIKNSNYYAEKIIVDQRNKKEVEENENNSVNATVSATPTPSVTLEETEHGNGTASANLDFNNILEAVQNLLNYLKNWISTI